MEKEYITTASAMDERAMDSVGEELKSSLAMTSSFNNDMDFIPKKLAVMPFAFLLMTTLSIHYYIVPQLLLVKLCHREFNNTVCADLGHHTFKEQENYVFNKAAEWNALITFAGYFPATVLTLPIGAMTDLISKKKMLLLPVIASLMSCLVLLCSSIFIKLHVGYLVLATLIISLFGEVMGCITLCCVYAVGAWNDNSTLAVSIVIASVQIGLGTGGLTVNYLKRYYGFSCVFIFTIIVLILNLVYAIVLIPPIDDATDKSSRERNRLRKDFKELIKDTCRHLASFTKKYICHAEDKTLLLLLIAAFLNLASYGGERALITLFLKHSPLALKADKIGIYFVLFQWTRASGLILLVLVINRYWNPSDYTLMFIGTAGMIVNYTVTSISTTILILYLSTILALPASFMASAVRSQLTKLVSPEEHGVSLSLIGLVDSVGNLTMAAVANGLFIATVKIYSGFSILLMSTANLVALGVLCFAFFITKRKSRNYEKVSSS